MSRRSRASDEMCQVRCVHPDVAQATRSLLHDDRTYTDIAALFAALADPTRAKIVHLLMHRELCTCDIAAAVGVTDSAVSQHLRLLRSLRLVKSRREGKFVYYSLDDAHIALLLQAGLTHQGHEAALQPAIPSLTTAREER